MRAYSYDPDTGEFIGWTECMADPLENPEARSDGAWLVPANATTVRPPTLVFGNVVVWRGGKWGYVLPDNPDAELSDVPIIPPDPDDSGPPMAPPEGEPEFEMGLLSDGPAPEDGPTERVVPRET
jgi:hypothetical protein